MNKCLYQFIRATARKWALTERELDALRTYFRGEQLAYQYDALSDTLKAAVNDVTRLCDAHRLPPDGVVTDAKLHDRWAMSACCSGPVAVVYTQHRTSGTRAVYQCGTCEELHAVKVR